MNRIITMGRGMVEAAESDPATHVISIASPFFPVADIAPGWGAVTYVSMMDWDDLPPDIEAVDLIVAAAKHALDREADLLIHCTAGVSRSVGVAKALSHALGYEYSSPFTGNTMIYRTVLSRWIPAITPATSRFRALGALLLIGLVAGCSTARDHTIANNKMEETQECQAKGGLYIGARFGVASVCFAVDSLIPLTAKRVPVPVTTTVP